MILKKKINCYSLFQNKEFVYAFVFLNNLKKALANKNVIVSESYLNFSGNKLGLELFLFYRTKKLLVLQKRFVKKRKKFSLTKIKKGLCHKFFRLSNKNIWKSSQSCLNKKLTSIVLKINNLNSFITTKKRRDLESLYSLSKKFTSSIFSRRFNFLIDFLKLTVLFSDNKVANLVYLTAIGHLFKPLQKKNHTKYFLWLKSVFSFLLKKKNVRGLKISICGKLKGKTRSSNFKIVVGSVPTQSINKDIQCSKAHVYTVLGAFGFKLWVNKK
jgi:hypothetical protein